jgi:alanine racemase
MDRRTWLASALISPVVGRIPVLAERPAPGQVMASPFDPWVEVHAGHLRHNVREIYRRVAARPVLAVIKNNAYGLGTVAAGRILEGQSGIAGLAVVKLDEAVALRDGGVKAPVLLMGTVDDVELGEALARDITPMVYTPVGDALERHAARLGRPIGIHVCVDTGIGRVGVPLREAESLVRDLAGRRSVRIDGIMMTFTEDPDFDPVQLRRFEDLVRRLGDAGIATSRRHAASSYALFGDEASFLDMVRPGMVVYGVYPEVRFRELRVLDLRPAVALRCRVIYVKRLEVGESAGYNRAFVAQEPTWVATLPVGHVDGLPRSATKGGSVRIGSVLHQVVAVSASHSIVVLGTEPGVQAGDVATVFDWETGSRPEDFAAATGASVYDLLMHLNPLLPRRLIG